MNMTFRPHWPGAADRALDIAETLRRQAEAAGQPPAVQGLPPGPAPLTTGSWTP